MKNTLVTVGLAVLIVIVYYVGKRYYLKPKIETGVKAANISGTLPDGSTFSLGQLNGKFVLLDFWGSWCKPCREAHPQLIRLYQDFQSAEFKNATGFEILSYGVEQNKASWETAIRQDGLLWPYHFVSTDLFESPSIKAFNVRQIPTRFLINPEGLIISVDPSIDQVRAILEKNIR